MQNREFPPTHYLNTVRTPSSYLRSRCCFMFQTKCRHTHQFAHVHTQTNSYTRGGSFVGQVFFLKEKKQFCSTFVFWFNQQSLVENKKKQFSSSTTLALWGRKFQCWEEEPFQYAFSTKGKGCQSCNRQDGESTCENLFANGQ